MTAQDWIDKNNGKFLDFDGYYGDQCVDEVQFYNRDVVGGTFLSGENASDIWNTYPTDFYDQIANNPNNSPQLGDIVIWSSDLNGGPGHIAVCISGNKQNFSSLDQNWVKGSACTIVTHNYNFVLGWLRPKNQSNINPAIIAQSITQPTPVFNDQTIIPIGVNPKTSTNFTGELQAVRSNLFDLENKRDQLANQVSILQNTVKTPISVSTAPTGTTTTISTSPSTSYKFAPWVPDFLKSILMG